MLGPMFGKLGLGQNVIRTIGAQDAPTRRRTVTAHLRAALVLSVVSSPVVALVATIGLLGRPEHITVVALTSLILVAETLRLLLSDVFAAAGDVRGSVASTHHVRTVVALPALLAVALVSARATLVEMLAVYAAVSVLLLAVAVARARSMIEFRGASGHGLRATVGTGLVLFALDASFFVVGRGDVWIASALFEPFDAARYGTVSMLAFQVTVLQGLVSLAITPTAARLWAAGRTDDVVRLLAAAASVTAALTAVVVVAVALAGGPLLSLAYGPEFRSSLPLFVVLACGGVAQAALGFSVPLLLVSGLIRRAVVACLAVLAAMVPCTIGAALLGGPLGLAAASALAAIALPVAQTVAAHGRPLPSWNLRDAVRVLTEPAPVSSST
jgi:O-antigen/teichoic acid export membrane protein